MSGGIGFYVHHHGQGHANRAQQIVAHLDESITVFGSSLSSFQSVLNRRVTVVDLPSDIVDLPLASHHQPDIFHYAPLAVPGIRERMFQLAEWIRNTDPALLVVDVSVEIALFARLMSVPTVIVRQNGVRDDPPHQAAFRSSNGLLAPFSSALEDETTPEWVRKKTFYAGGFSRYDQRLLSRAEARKQLGMSADQRYVIIMNGLGGEGNPLVSVVQAAQAASQWDWWVVGPTAYDRVELPANVTVVGKVEDTFPYLKGADVVVASAGNNTVMEIATAGTPYVCIPEERPFHEQYSKAAVLDQINAAQVLPAWPEPARWPTLLENARQMDTQPLANIIDPRGAERCAQYIRKVVGT